MLPRRPRWPRYTDDGPADWDAYCEHQDALHDMFPLCIECDHVIDDERCWDFGDGPMHEECAEKKYLKWTADLIE